MAKVKKALKKTEKIAKSKGSADKKAVSGSVKKGPKKKALARSRASDDDDDLEVEDLEADSAVLDADKLAAEVELSEGKAAAGDDDSVDAVQPPPPVLPQVGEPEDESDVDSVMPSMEGMSILRETEINDVIQDVKRRSDANGGYITYEDLNLILPSTIVDAIQSEKYLKILESLGVQVIREEDVKKYLEAKNAKQSDQKTRSSDMIEDPIRMYLHQMGQVQLLSRDEEVSICSIIEEAEAKAKDMFNRFLFAPPMYARLLDRLEGQCERFDRIVTDKFDDNRDAYMELIPGFRKQIKEVEKRLREASEKFMSLAAKRRPDRAALNRAEKGLTAARQLLQKCFVDLSFKQKVLETLCADADERIYLPYRALMAKRAQLLTLRPSKKRDADLAVVKERMAKLESLFGMPGEEFVTTFAELRRVLKAGQTARTWSRGMSTSFASSFSSGSRPSFWTRRFCTRISLLIVSIMCTGMRIVLAWSAIALVAAWRIHHVA